MNFDDAFTLLISPSEEGGYVDNRVDPGGKTKYGITEKVARAHGYLGDMTALPVDTAKAIYKSDYWGPAGCDTLPDAIKYPVFAMYVNCPPKATIKALQSAAGIAPILQDGVLGPHTLQAVNSVPPALLQFRFSCAKMLYYTSCYDWPAFGRGWTIREMNNGLNKGLSA